MSYARPIPHVTVTFFVLCVFLYISWLIKVLQIDNRKPVFGVAQISLFSYTETSKYRNFAWSKVDYNSCKISSIKGAE